jgi:hypothetical protein
MAAKMDKSLEDIIAEERSKSKPRAASSAKPRGKSEQDHRRPKDPRPDSRRDTRRSGPKPDVDGPPPRDPAYYLVGNLCFCWLQQYLCCSAVTVRCFQLLVLTCLSYKVSFCAVWYAA